MSSDNTLDTLAQEVIAQLPVAFTSNYVDLCAAVLLLYDYFLTLPLELKHIWRGKTNAMKLLFVLNRYASLVFVYGRVLFEIGKAESNIKCRTFFYIQGIFNIVTVVAQSSAFTLRTYVIYRKSKFVLFLLAIPLIVVFSSSIWLIVMQTPVAFPPELQIGPFSCGVNTSASLRAGEIKLLSVIQSSSHRYLAQLVNIISAAVFDVLVVALTMYRTGRLALQTRKVNVEGSLSFIMARDGVLYYSAIFVPQYVLFALFAIVLKTESANLADVSDALTDINDALQVILISRLILNLSHAANAREDSEFRTRTGLEPPTFAAGPVLGNIGGSVRTLPDDLDDDMLEGDGTEAVEITTSMMSNVNETGEFSNLNSIQSGANFETEEISV